MTLPSNYDTLALKLIGLGNHLVSLGCDILDRDNQPKDEDPFTPEHAWIGGLTVVARGVCAEASEVSRSLATLVDLEYEAVQRHLKPV